MTATRIISIGLALGAFTPATRCQQSTTTSGRAEPPPWILVFSKAAGFRHAAIPDAVAAVESLGTALGFGVQSAEDAAVFTDSSLANFDAVIFLLTTGDVLDSAQQAAFERFVESGKGYVGVHSAADTEYEWAWYGGLVGAYFASHPAIQEAVVQVVDREHPATAHLPEEWRRRDEWYNYRAAPTGVRVLAVLDESTYEGGTQGTDHPIAWSHAYDGGRAFYSGLGHTEESWRDPLFLDHLLGGIEYAVGRPVRAGR